MVQGPGAATALSDTGFAEQVFVFFVLPTEG